MAEVTRVLREVQLNTEGGLVPARRRSKFVKDDSAAVGAAKADRKMAVARNKYVGSFTGVTKAELANKKAAGTSVVKAASSSDFADTKADAGNKETAGSFTGEIGVTKAGLGNKEVLGTSKPLVEIEKPKEERKVEIEKPKEERKVEKEKPLVTKERVPESHIARVKARPLRKIPPLSDSLFANNPRSREIIEGCIAQINYLVDMEQDCLRQHAEKGHAEIGVDFTSGVKKVFILPN